MHVFPCLSMSDCCRMLLLTQSSTLFGATSARLRSNAESTAAKLLKLKAAAAAACKPSAAKRRGKSAAAVPKELAQAAQRAADGKDPQRRGGRVIVTKATAPTSKPAEVHSDAGDSDVEASGDKQPWEVRSVFAC